MSKFTIDRTTFQSVAQSIAERFDPEQIILFGSHACGNAGSHSELHGPIVPKTPRSHPASVISNVGALSKYHAVSTVLASSRLSEVP